MRFAFLTLAVVGFTTALALSLQEQTFTYQLMQTRHAQLYIVDHDLTADDCDAERDLNNAYADADTTFYCRPA